MRFCKKVTFNDSRLWLHDEAGRPVFGILRGDVASLENAQIKPGERLELLGYQPNVGHRHVRFEGEGLAALLELLPLLRQALEAPVDG